VTGWASEGENGPGCGFGPRKKKKKKGEGGRRDGPAGLKRRRKERLCIFETGSNNSIQIQIQRIQIQIEQQAIK
jgi:hypothetical protein